MRLLRCLPRFTLVSCALALAALFIAGCNTVQGVGEDLSAVGQGLADVAEDVKD
ncbi:MAG: hypothetical protein L0Y44_13870 [Phycisphaerales bacterium]|nr:hypothetical protein [Phycisphaerales bacterium]MCI0631731.1 hypothetical protein [Phycisphaerales bacterium]